MGPLTFTASCRVTGMAPEGRMLQAQRDRSWTRPSPSSSPPPPPSSSSPPSQRESGARGRRPAHRRVGEDDLRHKSSTHCPCHQERSLLSPWGFVQRVILALLSLSCTGRLLFPWDDVLLHHFLRIVVKLVGQCHRDGHPFMSHP